MAETPKQDGFCVLPWLQPHLHQNGKVSPCCKIHHKFEFGNLKNENFAEIWNSEPAKNLRKSLINGEKPEVCKECWTQERSGLSSLRTESLHWLAQEVKSLEIDPTGNAEIEKIQCLDIRFSNLCNFKCRSCSEEYSTSWDMNSAKNLAYRLSSSSKENFWEILERLIPQLKNIYIAGGEPLIDPDHFRFLQMLINKNRTDIRLHYNTNLSHLSFKNQSFLKIWKNFERVQLGISVDAVKNQAEVLRKGTHWESLKRNILKLKADLPEVKLMLNPTVSVMNIFHIPEAIKYWVDEKILDESMDFQVNMVFFPVYLSINILNENERVQAHEKFHLFLNELKMTTTPSLFSKIEKQVQIILSSFSHPSLPVHRNLFRYVTFAIDKKRKENLVSHFPELFDLLYQDSNYG